MRIHIRKLYKFLSLAMIAALMNVSLATAFAASPQIVAKLLTTGGTVKVNDNDTPSGATIVSGATIETPASVGATIQVGDLGVVELPPDTIALIEFSGNNIKVTLKKGCAILDSNKGTTGSIVNVDGKMLRTNSNAEEGMPGDANYKRLSNVAASSDGTMRRRLPVCGVIVGAAPIPPVPPVGPVAGLSAGAIASIIAGVAGGAVIVGIIGTRGGDSSPSRP
jgi:hypothetical protein